MGCANCRNRKLTEEESAINKGEMSLGLHKIQTLQAYLVFKTISKTDLMTREQFLEAAKILNLTTAGTTTPTT